MTDATLAYLDVKELLVELLSPIRRLIKLSGFESLAALRPGSH